MVCKYTDIINYYYVVVYVQNGAGYFFEIVNVYLSYVAVCHCNYGVLVCFANLVNNYQNCVAIIVLKMFYFAEINECSKILRNCLSLYRQVFFITGIEYGVYKLDNYYVLLLFVLFFYYFYLYLIYFL